MNRGVTVTNNREAIEIIRLSIAEYHRLSQCFTSEIVCDPQQRRNIYTSSGRLSKNVIEFNYS
jgi:hypothetical protein